MNKAMHSSAFYLDLETFFLIFFWTGASSKKAREQGPQDKMMDGAIEFRALCSATQALSLDNDKVN